MSQECEKKEAQHAKTAKSAQNEINNLKKQLGIQSDNIQQDLSERIKTLPEIYDRIASKVKSVLPAVSFYTKFVEENMEMKVSVTLINFVAGLYVFQLHNVENADFTNPFDHTFI